MEETLKSLFDFQKFSGNPRLAEIISDIESRYGNVLSDDELEWVNAAGEPAPPHTREDTPDD